MHFLLTRTFIFRREVAHQPGESLSFYQTEQGQVDICYDCILGKAAAVTGLQLFYYRIRRPEVRP